MTERLPTHFLHIGKTGGSAVRRVLAPLAEDHGLRLWSHDVRLSDVPVGEKVVFAVRDPVSRFPSAFNARLRKSKVEAERRLLEVFPTPNHLAEALSADDDARREEAEAAMRTLAHVRTHLDYWLGSAAYLRSRRSDILWICWLPQLGEDFETLKAKLDLPSGLELPRDQKGANRTPPELPSRLSALGRRNIARWFAEDIALYRQCLRLRRSLTRPTS